MFRVYVGLQLRLRAALKVAVNTLVRVPLVMREPNVLGKLVYSICLEAADGTCNLALRVNVGLVSLKNITTLYWGLLGPREMRNQYVWYVSYLLP